MKATGMTQAAFNVPGIFLSSTVLVRRKATVLKAKSETPKVLKNWETIPRAAKRMFEPGSLQTSDLCRMRSAKSR